MLGVDLVGLGDVDAGLDHLRVAVRLARETGAVDSQLVSQHNLCFFLGQTDRFEEGLKVAFDGLETARRVGLERRYGAGLRASAGDILHRAGRWDEADEVTRAGLELDEDVSGWIYLQSTRALFLAARGEGDLAQEAIAAAGRRASPDIDADVRAYLLGATAEAAVLDDRPADALRAVEDGLAEFAGSDEQLLLAPLLVVGVTAAADLADHGRAFRRPADVEAARVAGAGLLEQARGLAAGRQRGLDAVDPGGDRRGRGRVDEARGDVGRGGVARGGRRLGGRPDALPGGARLGPRRRGDPARARRPRRGDPAAARGPRAGDGPWGDPAPDRDRVDRDAVADRGRHAVRRRRDGRREGRGRRVSRRPGGAGAGTGRDPRAVAPGSGRSSSSSPPAARTRRSRSCSSSARRRPASTSPTSSTSWA